MEIDQLRSLISLNQYKYEGEFTEDSLKYLKSSLGSKLTEDRLIYILYCLLSDSEDKIDEAISRDSALLKEVSQLRQENLHLRAELEHYKSLTSGQSTSKITPAYKTEISAVRIQSLLDAGKNISEIASELGISRGTVYSRIKEAGIK